MNRIKTLTFDCRSTGILRGSGREINGRTYAEECGDFEVEVLHEHVEGDFTFVEFEHEGRVFTACGALGLGNPLTISHGI